MQLRNLGRNILFLARLFWVALQGIGIVLSLALSLPVLILKAWFTAGRAKRRKEKLPAQVNVPSDPAILRAERIVERHLEKQKRKGGKSHEV